MKQKLIFIIKILHRGQTIAIDRWLLIRVKTYLTFFFLINQASLTVMHTMNFSILILFMDKNSYKIL